MSPFSRTGEPPAGFPFARVSAGVDMGKSSSAEQTNLRQARDMPGVAQDRTALGVFARSMSNDVRNFIVARIDDQQFVVL
jgi:hypothetical protein